MKRAPIANRKDFIVNHVHGDRHDPYFWMRLSDEQKGAKNPDSQTQDVVQYLKAENKYTDDQLNHTKDLQEEIFNEIKSRIVPNESSVPYLSKHYFYETRFIEGKEYPVYLRRAQDSLIEEVLLDANHRAEGHEYYQASGLNVSPNNKLLAFAEDVVSRRQYEIRFKDIASGAPLEDVIKNTSGSCVWAADNKTVFYTMKDDALRAFKIFKHIIGTHQREDQLVYHEEDEKFRTYIYKSKDDRFLIIGTASSLTTEYRYLNAENPDGEWQIFQNRILGVEYHISPFKNQWFILTNKDKAVNFKLLSCTMDDTKEESWETYFEYDSDVFIEDISLCNSHLVLSVRHEGNTKIKIYSFEKESSYYVDFGESAYMAFIGNNHEMESSTFRLKFTSMTTPMSTFDMDLESGQLQLLKQQEVLGNFDKNNYESRKEMALSPDGSSVPISIVYHKAHKDLNNKPLLLYAYGSYGYSMDPYFSISRLSLLDRGFTFAIAHIRGGAEKGRQWYEDGKFLNKKNTFIDFIACGEYLKESGLVAPDQLYAMGGSAGGLLMGAIMNMAPNLWAGIVAAVPFVDVLSTMIDESIPLTVGEYEEWGNPNDKIYFDYIRSYSPYDNIEAKDYPKLLITTGYHDSQVQYWEPAKWAAKLRHTKTDDHILLLHTNMGAGHGGASGRYRRFKETALEYAFLLDCAGV